MIKLVEAIDQSHLNAQIAVVISNQHCAGITHAAALGLKGKVAIVAGGGGGLNGVGNGRAASILLAEAGAKVIVVDKNLSLANNTVNIIREKGGEALGICGDLTQANECKKVVEFSLDNLGRLDILDNNIGIASKLSVVDETEEYWDHLMNINLKPMFLMSKFAIPAG